jgi:hypothetical protein
MNAHYEAVLADLRQVKADAEAGIAAIERLMARSVASEQGAHVDEMETIDIGPMPHGLTPSKRVHRYSDSIPQRVISFLQSQPGGAYSVGDIAKAIGAPNIQTLRGALIRMVASGKAAKHGRGLYRAPRLGERVSTALKDQTGEDA